MIFGVATNEDRRQRSDNQSKEVLRVLDCKLRRLLILVLTKALYSAWLYEYPKNLIFQLSRSAVLFDGAAFDNN